MSRSPDIAEAPRAARRFPLEWVALVLAAVILTVCRLHAFDLPLETDECNYIYIGARLLAGDRLYVDVWDHQPYGVFVLFAGVVALFGDGPGVFRWLATGFSLASLGFVFAIARLAGGRGAAILAAGLFALASSDPGTAGEGCNREIYMNAFILAGWYLALRAEGRSGGLIFSSGLALAVGSSLKTIVAIHWVLLAPWIVWSARHARPTATRLRSGAAALACFAAGPLLLWAASFGYFAVTGRLGEFVDAVLLFNLSYSEGDEGFLANFARFFAPKRHPFIFDSALPLWWGTIGAVIWLAVERVRARANGLGAILLLLVANYAAVCLPAHFWPHYYYLLIPAMVIAVAVAVARLVALPAIPEVGWRREVRRLAAVGFYAAFPIWLLAAEYRDYLSQPSFGITVKRYNSRDFWGRAQGENVRRITDPDDRIFVYGNDASVYYYARRRCASRYTMVTGLRSGYAGHEARRQTLLRELENDPPRLILVLGEEPGFAEWRSFLETYYSDPIGWDFHDSKGYPVMFVVARKGRPVKEIDWNWDRAEVGGWNVGGSDYDVVNHN